MTFKSFTNTLLVSVMGILCSCDPKEDNAPQLATIETGVPNSITAFHAVLEGTINDSEIISDINRGRCNFGFLYVLDSAVEGSADGMFQDYLSSGDMQGLSNGICNTIQPDGKFSVTITGLEPEQKIWYCAYVVRQDGTRLIGTTQSATTTLFQADMTIDETSNISYFTALLNCSIHMDEIDMKRCSFGFVFGLKPNVTVQDGIVYPIKEAIDKTGIVKYEAANLKANTTYYYRMYAKDNVTGAYSYSQEKSLATTDPAEMAVDLGLSVKWASCDLGATNYKELGSLYTWGDKTPVKYGAKVDYDYSNLGEDISGSQYDVVADLLGGKWRMPTEEEAQELLERCTFSMEEYKLSDTIYLSNNGMGVYSTTFGVWVVKGPNGNQVRIQTYFPKDKRVSNGIVTASYRWTGNSSGTTDAKAVNISYGMLTEEEKKYEWNQGAEWLEPLDRQLPQLIRPVCEY